jgi:hypothetical protein
LNTADEQRFFAKTKLADVPRPGMETPCLEWTASLTRGYGQFWLGGKQVKAHRTAWEMEHGPIPDGMDVLHKCDNPPCVADEHLFLGTKMDNVADMVAKGRQASGDANGSRIHPESRPRGDEHWARRQPERLARGDRSGARLHPERWRRGENHSLAKLNEEKVRAAFRLRAQGWTQTRIAAEFGVNQTIISDVLLRKIWKHVDLTKSEAEASA